MTLENIKNNKYFTSYKNWERKRKLIFWGGILAFVFLVLAAILSWKAETFLYIENIEKFSAKYNGDIVKEAIHSRVAQGLMSQFWSSTYTFTYISNFALAIILIAYAIIWDKSKIQKALFLSVLNITITFIIFWSLIFFQVILKFKANNTDKTVLSMSLVSQTLTHFVNPLIGMVALVLRRKSIILTKKLLWFSNLAVIIYYIFALGMFYMGQNVASYVSQKMPELDDVNGRLELVIYGFLNFENPMFYSGTNKGVVFALNLVIILMAFFVPVGIGWMWKFALRIKLQQSSKTTTSKQ
ncbi:MAGa3780 family membrane protein [Mycoplasma sp. 4044]